ncbi:MAG: PilZ domain-containing protein [Acidobacteriia bacterium]|nr:PilZ domain-containing protein [Terriglobia bacterium]
MRRSAAVLSQDGPTLRGLKTVLEQLGINQVICQSGQEAMELVMAGRCSTLIVDFDLPNAGEVVKMAALLLPPQKPALLAVASRAWPGTGQAFQSGADCILYKPLDAEQVKDAFETSHKLRAKNRRKAPRHTMKTVVYFELETGTLPALGIDISEHGFAVQATEPVPMLSNLAFRCVLPGTEHELHGHADVIWASDQGRAGLFFSRLAPSARKLLKQWLGKRGINRKDAARVLAVAPDASPCLVSSE